VKTYQQLIDDSLIPKERERSGKWNPSSFGMCYRQQFWNRKNEPKSEPIDERTLRIFKAGQLFEDFVVGLLPKDNGYQFQVKVETDDILGYADIVSENEVADCKSVHSKSFWWMTKSQDIKKDKYHNWLQVMYYATELNKQFGRLVFVSKDDLCIQEYVQPVDDYWKREINAEIATLRFLWDSDILPKAEPRCTPKVDKRTGEITYWQCSYCSFLTLCLKTEQEAKREHPHKM
jgi:hypothetical protein